MAPLNLSYETKVIGGNACCLETTKHQYILREIKGTGRVHVLIFDAIQSAADNIPPPMKHKGSSA